MAIDIGPATTAPQTTGKAARPRFHFNQTLSLGGTGIGAHERMLFTERIELLLETGVSLVGALQAMKLQTEAPRIADIIESLITTVSEGKPFADALARHPEMFPQTYVSLVAAAEQGGFLPEVLRQLREMDEKNSRMQATIVSALSYPVFLIAFSVAVVIFVLVVIFPKFNDMFVSIRDQLPGPTIVLMFLSNVLRNHWLLTLAVAGGALAALVFWARSPAGARRLDELKLGAPFIREIYIRVYLNQALGVLGMSLANGVPIVDAINATRGVIKNSVFAEFLKKMLRDVEDGRGIAVAFEEAAFVPPMVRQMISTGEQTGNLAKVMNRVADFYARELDKRITAFAKAVEPVMLVVMGVVVGLIVAALILPIFKLSRAIH